MFFILSKVLLVLIQPICWVLYLLVIAFIIKNPKLKKRLFIIALSLLYFFSNNVMVNEFSRMWDVTSATLKPGTYSCAIVIGGFTSVDKNGKGYFNGAANRYISAVNLYETGKAKKLMISGGSGLLLQGSEFKEADFVLSQLRLLKIPDSSVLAENKSRNTWENAVFTKNVLAANKIHGPYLLVTSAFHMRRAIYTFKKIGLDVVPYTGDPAAGDSSFSIFDFLVPSPLALLEWNGYSKELVGYITYRFKSYH